MPISWQSFNPKREAHPLQTQRDDAGDIKRGEFQSQTGSPSSSDTSLSFASTKLLRVSIPNGKPILFRHLTLRAQEAPVFSFNPKREAHPLQTAQISYNGTGVTEFQSQTGSPSSSDAVTNGYVVDNASKFQSQTGSPSSSDDVRQKVLRRDDRVSIPNGKPILFRHGETINISSRQRSVSIPNGKPILFRP